MDTTGHDPAAAGLRVARLRNARGWTQERLATEAKLSRQYIIDFEAGRAERPHASTLAAIAAALDWPSWDALMASRALEPPGGKTLNVGEIVQRAAGGKEWPIYDGAGCGNPVAVDEAQQPIPVDRVQLEGDKARMVGPDGFGVRVKGESMANWEFHDRDVCWVNPRVAPRLNWPVLALVTLEDGRQGMAIKVLKEDGSGGRYLANDGADGTERVELVEATLIGPVVLHDPVSRVPRRRNINDEARHLVDWTVRDAATPGTPAGNEPGTLRPAG